MASSSMTIRSLHKETTNDHAAQLELTPPPTDVISSVRFNPNNPTSLVVSSWDRHLYLYDTSAASGSMLQARYEHRAPVLDCAWVDDNSVYSVGLDHDVRRLDLASQHQTVASTHSKPSNRIVYHAASQVLISASWDCTLHIHLLGAATQQPAHYAVVPLPAKPFSLALSPSRLIVAMSDRQLYVYDMTALSTLASQVSAGDSLQAEPLQRRESALKFMTRAIAAMPNDLGFACSSIEGRVAVEWFDPAPDVQAKKYAFKCHRVAEKEVNPEDGTEQTVDIVYPVHCLAFHPVHGTFASGGGDGNVALWDAAAKRRLRQYQRYAASIGAMEFAADGKWLAIGVSPGYEDAGDSEDGNLTDGPVQVFVRDMPESEVRGKSGK